MEQKHKEPLRNNSVTTRATTGARLKTENTKQPSPGLHSQSTLNTASKVTAQTITNNSTITNTGYSTKTGTKPTSNGSSSSSGGGSYSNTTAKQKPTTNTTIKSGSSNSTNSVKTAKPINVSSATISTRPSTSKPLNTTKSKVTSSNIVTKSESDKKARESIQHQTTLNTINKVSARTTIHNTTVVKRGYNTSTNPNASILANAKNTVKNSVRNQDDRTSAVATAITVGDVAIKTFKSAQDISPYAVKAVARTGLGVQSSVNGLKTGIGNTVNTARYLSTQTKYFYQNAKSGVVRSAKVTRGVINGSVSLKVDKNTLSTLKTVSLKGFSKGGVVVGRTLKTGAKIGLRTSWGSGKLVVSKGYRTVKGGYKGIKTGVAKAGDFLSSQDDTGAQALGLGIKSTRYTVKAIKSTPNIIKGGTKTIRTAVNVPIKTAKGVAKFGKSVGKFSHMVKNYGLKSTMAYHKAKSMKAVQKAGGSVVSAIIEGLKKLLSKAFIPIIIIILLLVVCMNLIVSSGSGAYQVLFGWTSTNKDTGEDIDERVWLTQKITTSRAKLVQDIKDLRDINLKENGGEYHYVRLFNAFSDSEIELTDTNILSSVYTVDEYYEYIQPIFHVMLLSEYDLEATPSQMTALYEEIWNKLTIVKTKPLPIEYCGGATAPCSECGSFHADISLCPNYTSGTHGAYTCSVCCYHDTVTETKTSTNFFTGKVTTTITTTTVDKCNGWYSCGGHKILGITITVGSFSDLLNDYFLFEINSLESRSSLSETESQRLEQLKENYEICINYLQTLENELGLGTGTIVELGDVTLTQVTEFACQYIGNTYVYGGTDVNNGIDCSAFMRYIYAQFGVSLPRTSREQVLCGTTVSSLAEAQAGDLIFYSDNGTIGGVYHVTMYLGNGKMVHASNSKPYPAGGIKISNVYGTPFAIKRIAN